MERIANEKIKFPPDFNATTSSFAKGFQKPVMFSSATPSTSWVMLPIVIPQNLLRKKERKVGENSKYLIVENGVFLTMNR